MALTPRAFRVACIALCLACVAVAVLVRLRFLEFPLERDEGEYAYAGQLLLRGVPPYQMAYNMKFPGTYVAYAAMMAVFGESTLGIHAGLLLVNCVTIACVFVVGCEVASAETGLLAAAFYAVLSLSPRFAGLCAHATHFVVLPMLIGVAMLLRRNLSWLSVVGAGVFFGIALLMKQPAAFFLPLGCVAIALSNRNGWKCIAARGGIFVCGAAIPLVIMLLFLAAAGTLARFKYWAVDYASAYGTLISPLEGLRILSARFPRMIGGQWLLWSIATAGAVAAIFTTKLWKSRGILLAFIACSVAAVCPGFYFREHYFILLLPAIALAAAATLTALATQPPTQVAIAAVAVITVALPLYSDRQVLFQVPLATASRLLYWPSPFAEASRIADFVRARTTAEETIAVLGSEPEIYFYANRRSATGYIYTYALVEPHARASEMQREMIAEIERAQPKFLIVIGSDVSWLRRPASDRTIFQWANDYCGANYNVAGLVNLVSPERTDWFLPLDLSTPPPPLAENYVLVYERRTAIRQ